MADIRIDGANPIIRAGETAPREITRDEDFSFALKRLGQEGLRERVTSLMSDITAQGKRIADHMDIKDIKRYRALIGEFINEVVTNAHHFERENFLDRRGRHRVYGIVKMVNKDLDDIARELLKAEKDHIKILDKTGEIDGLLLDMLV
ncbi:MAG: YaaR family protein [Clostridiales bacterium]|jgi:uncharacterized protein YaaR (DUF327 family)|nr:YaaR family protein [Clostridiales bacterium]